MLFVCANAFASACVCVFDCGLSARPTCEHKIACDSSSTMCEQETDDATSRDRVQNPGHNFHYLLKGLGLLHHLRLQKNLVSSKRKGKIHQRPREGDS